jgi:hypothetical protein
MHFFKRQAPKKLKKEDLIVKSSIIPESARGPRLPVTRPETALMSIHVSREMRNPALILYSQQIYGG